MSMLPLALHHPVAMEHPLVAPWAKAQTTETASLYASREAPERAAWQVPAAALEPRVLVASSDASRSAKTARGKRYRARLTVRDIMRVLARGTVKLKDPDDATKTIDRDLTADEVERLETELEQARVDARHVAVAPRAERRARWRAKRAQANELRLALNSTKPEEARQPHAGTTATWRGLWNGARA